MSNHTFKEYVQEQNLINNMMTIAEEVGCNPMDDNTMEWKELSLNEANEYLQKLIDEAE